ncbi:MAG: hypothetical protein KDJ77_13670, partial [Rhodobiaceae bacterium]|nr:hypothetical protein [Rhodobiaceae bacterium]
ERALLAAEAHAAEDMPATGDARPGDPLVVDSDMIARVEDTLSEMEPQGRDSFIKLSLSAVNRWSNGRKIAIFS